MEIQGFSFKIEYPKKNSELKYRICEFLWQKLRTQKFRWNLCVKIQHPLAPRRSEKCFRSMTVTRFECEKFVFAQNTVYYRANAGVFQCTWYSCNRPPGLAKPIWGTVSGSNILRSLWGALERQNIHSLQGSVILFLWASGVTQS